MGKALIVLMLACFMYVTQYQDPGTSIPRHIEYTFTAEDKRQIKCLGETIFFECRGCKAEVQQAVASVVLNRSRNTGRTICQVVYRPKQFSWTANSRAHKAWAIAKEAVTYNRLMAKAEDIYKVRDWYDTVDGRDHFYSPGLMDYTPRWARAYAQTAMQMGPMVFLKGT